MMLACPAAIAEIFRELDRDGLLKLRVYGMANPPEGREVAFVSEPPAASGPADRFRLRAIKLFMDGAMGSRGALLLRALRRRSGESRALPDRAGAAPGGDGRGAPERLAGLHPCDRRQGQCPGRSTRTGAALTSVPEATDPRLRVEHAQVVRLELTRPDSPRPGIIASMQPSHASTDQRWADARLGPDRVAGAYAWRWFRDAGVRLAFGSDFPVEVPSPFWGLYAAITRRDARRPSPPAAGDPSTC